jgi:hypothetical protein
MFNLNKNTVYSDAYLRLRTETET